MSHLDNGKLKKGYQRAVDDYNETITKHKEAIDKLKTEYEQSLKEPKAGSVGVGGEVKPTPQKIKVLGKDVNMYNDYIPSKIEDVELDAMYSFNANSKSRCGIAILTLSSL